MGIDNKNKQDEISLSEIKFSKTEIRRIIFTVLTAVGIITAIPLFLLNESQSPVVPKPDASAVTQAGDQKSETSSNPSPPAPLHQQNQAPAQQQIIFKNTNNAPSVSDPSKIQQIKYYLKNEVRNIKFITSEINGESFEFIFDTGASDVSLNSETIQKLGIKDFSKAVQYGTASGVVTAYKFSCNSVKIAAFEIRNVDCSYNPSAKHNLFGNTFLSHFNYYIDELSQTITLVSKSEKAELVGGELRIPKSEGYVEIGGKRYEYVNGQLKRVQ
ncbi:MAG: retroviral-like aspartic protease family protein [Nitrospiraceae bacterium]|nr:retroviral-like aspartic protease family protein [Nitrospiraceae bacterium]